MLQKLRDSFNFEAGGNQEGGGSDETGGGISWGKEYRIQKPPYISMGGFALLQKMRYSVKFEAGGGISRGEEYRMQNPLIFFKRVHGWNAHTEKRVQNTKPLSIS